MYENVKASFCTYCRNQLDEAIPMIRVGYEGQTHITLCSKHQYMLKDHLSVLLGGAEKGGVVEEEERSDSTRPESAGPDIFERVNNMQTAEEHSGYTFIGLPFVVKPGEGFVHIVKLAKKR